MCPDRCYSSLRGWQRGHLWRMWGAAMVSTLWSGRTLLCWAVTAAVAWPMWPPPVWLLALGLPQVPPHSCSQAPSPYGHNLAFWARFSGASCAESRGCQAWLCLQSFLVTDYMMHCAGKFIVMLTPSKGLLLVKLVHQVLVAMCSGRNQHEAS